MQNAEARTPPMLVSAFGRNYRRCGGERNGTIRRTAASHASGRIEDAGARTQDPRLKRPLLCQLSYVLRQALHYSDRVASANGRSIVPLRLQRPAGRLPCPHGALRTGAKSRTGDETISTNVSSKGIMARGHRLAPGPAAGAFAALDVEQVIRTAAAAWSRSLPPIGCFGRLFRQR